MSDDLFNSSNDQDKTPDNPLEALVGEGKKFQTPEDLAKGKLESDKYIAQLELEKKALLEDMNKLEAEAGKAATLQEVLDKLKPAASSDDERGNQSLNEEELSKLVQQQLNQHEVQKQQKDNRTKANAELLSHFQGDADKAKQFIKQKANELGVSTDDLGKMAETSPKAYSAMLGINAQPGPSSAPITTEVNTAALNTGGSDVRSVEYYRKMRQENRKLFFSPSTQQEIFKVAESNGGPEFIQKILG